MKSFIKNRLREFLLENNENTILSQDDLKTIENEVNNYYNQIEAQVNQLNTVVQSIKTAIDKELNNPNKSVSQTTLSFYKELLQQKETELKNAHLPSKENLRQYYIQNAIKKANELRQRNDYKQQREKEGITKENIIDLFVTALEGGSNHWYELKTLPNKVVGLGKNVSSAEAIGEHILNGGYIQFYDIENDNELLGTVEMDNLLDGIQLLKTKYPEVYENIIMDEYDAGDADIFLQLCVMGEVVFG